MSSTLKKELNLIFATGRLNRIHYLAYTSILTLLFSLCIYFANYIPFAVFLGFLAFDIVVKLWWMKRRLNDVSYSGIRFLIAFIVAPILIFAPAILIGSSDFPPNQTHSLIKLLTAGSYLIGMVLLIGTTLFLVITTLLFKGAPSNNQYGAAPAANNLFIISVAIISFTAVLAITVMYAIKQYNEIKMITFEVKNCHAQSDDAYRKILIGTWILQKDSSPYIAISTFSDKNKLEFSLFDHFDTNLLLLAGHGKWQVKNGQLLQTNLVIDKKADGIPNRPANYSITDKIECASNNYYRVTDQKDGATVEFLRAQPW